VKYVSLVLLGLLMAVLAGCGGGGDDGVARTLEEDLALVQADLEAAQSELATTKADLEAREAELTTAQADLATAQSELAATKETLTTTQETLTTTQTDLVDANADLETKESELATTKADLMTTETELDTAEDQLTTARINLATATANLTNAQANLMTAQADLTAAEADLEAKTTELTTTQADLTTARANLATAQDSLTTARADLKTAQDDLAAETTKLLTAQADLKTAQDTLETVRGTLTTTQSALTTARTRVTTLEGQVTTLQGQLGQAQQGQQQAQQQAQTLEANQRARNLLEAFDSVSPQATSPATITVPSRDRLTFKQGERRVSTISAPGLRGARLTRTRGGTDTTVVYTDRELSRELLEHYAEQKDPDAARFNAVDSDNVDVGASGTNFHTDPDVTIDHGLRTSLSANHQTLGGEIVTTGGTETNRALTSTKASFSGRVHGVQGRFQCAGDDCMITVTNSYNDDVPGSSTTDENRLATVRITTNTGTALYFKPNSATATVSLCEDGTQCTAGDDGQYMTFGWWRDEPESALADYKFGVFAGVTGGAPTTGLTGTAEYDGRAVGMYVEQGALGSTGVTTRQGEFTADVRLDVNFEDPDGAGSEEVGITGRIDGFKTAPTGGSSAPTTTDTWVVELTNAGTVTASDANGTASIAIPGTTTTTGAWSHDFVNHHANPAASAKPPAVTGTFNAEIVNLLHLMGAFGAELQ
jgi:multidrug resistance efflux pump